MRWLLAFANTRDGGVILVGVDDKSGALEGLTEEQAASFDQTKFNDFIQRYTEPNHAAYVYRVEIDGKRLVVIDVPEFSELPVLCARDANSSVTQSKLILRKAALYKRTDKATSEVIGDAQDMRELLNRGLLRRQDELLRAFKQITQAGQYNSPTEVGAEFKDEVREAGQYFSELSELSGESTYWALDLRPGTYLPSRIQSAAEIQALVKQSAISLRGWTFPIAGRINNSKWINFDGGCQSAYVGEMHSPEGLRVYKSGLFVWRSGPWEDYWEAYANQRATSFIALIYATTEWVLFAKRFYEAILAVDESIHLTLRASGVRGRKLISADPLVELFANYQADVGNFKIEEVATISDLRADPEAIGRRLVRRIFELYNWNDPREQMLIDWQRRFIQRQF